MDPEDALESHEEVVLTHLFRRAIEIVEADPGEPRTARLVVNVPAATLAPSVISPDDFSAFRAWLDRYHEASHALLRETQAEISALKASNTNDEPKPARRGEWIPLAVVLVVSMSFTLGTTWRNNQHLSSDKSSNDVGVNELTTSMNVVSDRLQSVEKKVGTLTTGSKLDGVIVGANASGTSSCTPSHGECASVFAKDERQRDLQIGCDTTVEVDAKCASKLSTKGVLISATDKRSLQVRSWCLLSTPLALCALK